MKTNFTKLLSICFFLFLGYAASAQDTRSVGETHAYTVTPENAGNTLAWTISGTSGTDWSITAGGLAQASVTILWQKPGTYNMTFTETENHGAVDCSTVKTLTVTVTDNFDVVITDATSICATGSTGTTDVAFTLTKTNGANGWSFDYTTVGLTPELTGTAVAATGGTHTLTLSVPNLAAGADQTFSVQLSNVKDSYGNNDSNAANNVTGDVTVYGVPNTGSITY